MTTNNLHSSSSTGKYSPSIIRSVILLFALCFPSVAACFLHINTCNNHKQAYIHHVTSTTTRNPLLLILQSTSEERGSSSGGLEKKKKDGYQFGDISKSVVRALGKSVTKVTGKEEYKFGDLSRWVDAQAKEKVNQFTNKDGEYQFGDISKEIIRRVRSGDFTLDDIVILCKVLISFGVGLQPVASFLPVKLLVEMLNYSIAADLGDKMVGAVATELDKRMKQAITGDEYYRIGDLTLRAVNKFTGNNEYSFGDITKKITNMNSSSSSSSSTNSASDETATERVELGVIGEDGVLDVEFVRELEQWDEKTEEIRNRVKSAPDYGQAG